ncbi:MAG: hypothetical protein WBV28_15005 [Terracidiphilus sp.]
MTDIPPDHYPEHPIWPVPTVAEREEIDRLLDESGFISASPEERADIGERVIRRMMAGKLIPKVGS